MSVVMLMTLKGARKPSSMPSLRLYVYTGSPKYEMLEMYRVSLGVAVMPICVAAEKY